MPVNLYYTQRVRGFQQESVKYSKESVDLPEPFGPASILSRGIMLELR